MECTSSPSTSPPTVHLVRHGETLGYSTDAGLTLRGRQQAAWRADRFAAEFSPAERICVVHSPRARAAETAEVIVTRLRGCGRFSAGDVCGPALEVGFDNFHVWTAEGEQEVTAAYRQFRGAMAAAAAPPAPGWVAEADRFWHLHESGGDPIGHWLSQPLQHFEPAAVVVRRFWRTTVELVDRLGCCDQIVVCTHSGPIRAIATHALGHDPGEPDHLEILRVEVGPVARIVFRGEAIDLDLPTSVQPSWFA